VEVGIESSVDEEIGIEVSTGVNTFLMMDSHNISDWALCLHYKEGRS
jgi:hypothetical protein